uniref:Uncharacterized protein n=1 Tax=Sphaerodactylus townsendi TaxID=933632 RepID=A0ACB8E875_9SAUR
MLSPAELGAIAAPAQNVVLAGSPVNLCFTCPAAEPPPSHQGQQRIHLPPQLTCHAILQLLQLPAVVAEHNGSWQDAAQYGQPKERKGGQGPTPEITTHDTN